MAVMQTMSSAGGRAREAGARWRWSPRLSLAAVLIGLAGCSEAAQYPPADPAALAKVKAPTPLAEIVGELGEPHEPTGRQAEQMRGAIERMPQRYRGDAEADRTVAWGDDSAFLVAKVNSAGVVWVTTYATGGGGSGPPPQGDRAFRDFRPPQ